MALPPYSPSFLSAVNQTLGKEGLDSDHPADRGGRTRYGITEALARQYGFQVTELTRDQAVFIYHQEFWSPLGLDRLDHPSLAFEIFDTAVNMGKERAVEIAQQAAWFFGFFDHSITGVLGPITVGALNTAGRTYLRQLLLCMNGLQFMRYYDIADNDATQRKAFFKGWMMRLDVPDHLD